MLVVAFAAWTIAYSKGYQRSNQDHEADYAAHHAAQRDYEECLAKPTVKEAVECTKEADNAYRESARADQDLNAQREMADWAEGMLWATAAIGTLTIFVTGLGVYWVRETLLATTRLTEAQLRAYIVVKEASAIFVRNANNRVTGVRFRIILANGGATPAVNVGHHFHISEPILGPAPPKMPKSARSVVVVNSRDHRIEDISPDGELIVFDQAIPIVAFNTYIADNGKLNCNLTCHVQYRPVVGDDDKLLTLNYWIRSDSKGREILISRSGANETT